MSASEAPPSYEAPQNSGANPTVPSEKAKRRPTQTEIKTSARELATRIVDHTIPMIRSGRVNLSMVGLPIALQKSAEFVPDAEFDWAEKNDRIAKQHMFDITKIINSVLSAVANPNGYLNVDPTIKSIVKSFSEGTTVTNINPLSKYFKEAIWKIKGDPYVLSCVCRFIRDGISRSAILVPHDRYLKGLGIKTTDQDEVDIVIEIVRIIYGRTIGNPLEKIEMSLVMPFCIILIIFEEALNGVVNATNERIMAIDEVECLDKFYVAILNYLTATSLDLRGTSQGRPFDPREVKEMAGNKDAFRKRALDNSLGGSMRPPQ